MTDLRTVKGRPDLETDGFTYVTNRKVAGLEVSDTLTEEDIKILIDDSIQLAKELTGAKVAIPFFPITRHNTAGETEDTFHEVHSDYTLEFVKEAINMYNGFVQVGPSPPSVDPNDIDEFNKLVKAGERALLLNVWRPIRTVESVPLGLVSWKSVEPTKNMWPHEYCAERKGYKRQYWTYNSKHKWFYTSNQEPEEVYVMLQHENSGIDGHGVHVPHVAFHHPETKEGAAGRFSFDIRLALAGVNPKIEPSLDFSKVAVPRFYIVLRTRAFDQAENSPGTQ
ncbi:hypothetical protein CROQUDRAFT_715304 [Cronartium quercuum f. sp. fusiforme G11]|uniref:Uncharacterized protein n=1 Tax=Cronartium quercuum f. sp. fusiforme G11 TaxID=708437 RepID=A0A9P6NJ26_9BASI|nr:hypothetical protein CROQUDRAFT_715304 [Cronartium quercuum f. sp. fusiforme G11]